MTRVHRNSTYTLEIDDQIFPIPFNDEYGTMEATARLWMDPTGTRAVIGCLCTDDNAQNPIEGYDEGTYVTFDGRGNSRPEIDSFKRLIRENPGRLSTFSTGNVHGAGTHRHHITGPLTVKDTKGDPCHAEEALDRADGYYICPDDAPGPASYTRATLANLDDYYNGEVYGMLVWIYERETPADAWEDPDRDAEFWGYIGSDYAEQELTEQFTYYTTKGDNKP